MKPAGKMEGDNEALRERLTRLNQASLRINECLDFNTVLQGVLDSARSLTGACYGVMTFLDDSGFSASSFFGEDNEPWRIENGESGRSPSASPRGAESMDDADQTGRVNFPTWENGLRESGFAGSDTANSGTAPADRELTLSR